MLRVHYFPGRCVALAIGGVVAAATFVAAQTPSPAPSGSGSSRLRAGTILFAGTRDHWAWVHATGLGETLYEGGPGQAPRALGRGSGWSNLAVDGSQVWLIRQTRRTASLAQVDPSKGGEPKVVVNGLDAPSGLFAQDGKVYWLENRPPGNGGFSFLPSLGSTCVLRVREASGGVRTLAEWPGGGGEGPELLPQDILGKVGDQLYLRIRRPASTELVRVSCESGSAQRVAVERGLQRAVLHRETLCWTAPSAQAEPASEYVCVRSLAASGETRTLADWLPGDGELLPLQRGLLYARDGLYRVSGRDDRGAWAGSLPRERVATDGTRLLLLNGEVPAVHAVKGL